MSDERMPWEEFKRTRAETFYGCVNKDGMWFDSSESFDIAVHWCCCYAGQFDLTPRKETDWMCDEGRKRGLSIIHSDMLRQMYEKGLIV